MTGSKTLLVFGGGGLLAREVAPAFTAQGWQVALVGRADCDITDAAAVQRQLEQVKPTLVLNCAAYTKVDQAERDQAEAFRVNATGPGVIGQATRAAGIPWIHISTDYVFDGKKRTPYSEDDAMAPLGVYARSKAEGESAVRSAAGAWTIVRTGELYGAGGPNFFAAIFKRALAGQPLKVVDDQTVSPTWTREIARQLAAMALRAPPGLYHATCAGQTTWFHAARVALDHAKVEVPLAPVTTAEFASPTPRPPYTVLAPAALKKLGLYVMRPWDVALKEWLNETALLAGPKP